DPMLAPGAKNSNFNPTGRPSSEFSAVNPPTPGVSQIEALNADEFMTDGAAAGQAANATGKPILQAQEGAAAALQPDKSAQYEGSPAGTARNSINRATRALLGPVADEMRLTSATTIEGSLERLQVATLLQALSMSQVTGKLEIIGEES